MRTLHLPMWLNRMVEATAHAASEDALTRQAVGSRQRLMRGEASPRREVTLIELRGIQVARLTWRLRRATAALHDAVDALHAADERRRA
jgi:hypothetical protein